MTLQRHHVQLTQLSRRGSQVLAITGSLLMVVAASRQQTLTGISGGLLWLIALLLLWQRKRHPPYLAWDANGLELRMWGLQVQLPWSEVAALTWLRPPWMGLFPAIGRHTWLYVRPRQLHFWKLRQASGLRRLLLALRQDNSAAIYIYLPAAPEVRQAWSRSWQQYLDHPKPEAPHQEAAQKQ